MSDEIRWTNSYFEDFNRRAKAIGFPEVIISDGYVYKDELHKLLGIGVKLEEDPE